ncbi:MAG: hypothetical protein ACXABY_00865 [Candidatus Thorarchaeota archaeon]
MKKLVVYSSDNEILVCREKDEKQMIQEYFTEGGRDLDCYTITMTSSNQRVVEITLGSLLVEP